MVFTDGVCQRQDDARISAAGCGIFVCKEQSWNTSFALPGVVQSSELAELRALLHAAEGATQQDVDIIVKLDNQYVADAAAEVLAGSKTWPANGHHLWQRLFIAQVLRRSSGGCGHQAVWIKGHATLLDVSLGIVSFEERAGNSAADRLASLAASQASCPKDLLDHTKLKVSQTEFVQRFLVEVLLSRYLYLFERRPLSDQEVCPQVAPLPVSADGFAGVSCDAASIRAAFLAWHSF